MKKEKLVVVLICGVILFACGCIQQNDDNTGNTVIINAKEHSDDKYTDTDWITYISIYYISLEDGDSLIIRDIISNIYYDSETDTTAVKFNWTDNGVNSSFAIVFAGDLSGTFQSGDEVNISVKIKHVTFSYGDMNYDLEIYEEQWENQEYFVSNVGSALGGLKPLPQKSITKA